MKHPPKRDESDRFKGALRHYHRAGGQTQRTWDEWIDGKPGGSRPALPWLKIILSILGLLALAGIAAGLFIELR